MFLRNLIILLFIDVSIEVIVYELSGDDSMIVNNTFTEQSYNNFSICLYFQIDKFGDNYDVTILKLKQRHEKEMTLRIIVKMRLGIWGGFTYITPIIIINGEKFQAYGDLNIKKDVWNHMCLGIDWENKMLGK